MIQTKTIAILMIAIATVGVIGTAGLFVHANAAVLSNYHTNLDTHTVREPVQTSSSESLPFENPTATFNQHNHLCCQ